MRRVWPSNSSTLYLSTCAFDKAGPRQEADGARAPHAPPGGNPAPVALDAHDARSDASDGAAEQADCAAGAGAGRGPPSDARTAAHSEARGTSSSAPAPGAVDAADAQRRRACRRQSRSCSSQHPGRRRPAAARGSPCRLSPPCAA